MSTPIRRRFSVNTSVQDSSAGTQSLSRVAVICITATAIGDVIQGTTVTQPRHTTLFRSSWRDDPVVAAAIPADLYLPGFMASLFGQSRSPADASIIWWNEGGSETAATAIQDAIDSGVNAFFVASQDANGTAASITKAVEISTFCQTSETRLMPVFATNYPDTVSGSATDDLISQLANLAHDSAQVYYYPAVDGDVVADENAAIRADAAILGYMSGGLSNEGTEQWDYKALAMLPDPMMTEAQQNIVLTKGGNFVERFERTTFTHVFRGRTVTGREARIQWGVMWHDVTFEQNLATRQFNTALSAFDRETFDGVENICYAMKSETLARRIIVDTDENPAIISFPDPDSFSDAEKQTGIANLDNVYSYKLNSAIDEWRLTGTWTIGAAS